MRFKKGFTLAEILIVLMVLGIISVMTIPNLIDGFTHHQYITAYKKAFSQIKNIAAGEKTLDTLPTDQSTASIKRFFSAMVENMSVKSYYDNSGDDTAIINASSFTLGKPAVTDTTSSYWLNTDDGMSYKIIAVSNASSEGGEQQTNSCSSITTIMAASEPSTPSCAIVMVDVNGLTKGPNTIEPQAASGIAATNSMVNLTGDRYYIYIGNDGATAGSESTTVGGRIVADAK